jgi:hypothetical protein
MDNCNGYVLSVTRFFRSASGSTTDPSKRKDVQDVMVHCDGYVLSVTGFSVFLMFSSVDSDSIRRSTFLNAALRCNSS